MIEHSTSLAQTPRENGRGELLGAVYTKKAKGTKGPFAFLAIKFTYHKSLYRRGEHRKQAYS
jgi:hypothetical protein